MRAPSLTGRLEDIPLPELLQFLATTQKSGRLALSRREGDGLVVLRDGRILYAASSSIRESFGSILLCRGLIDEATLAEAIERQHGPGQPKRLGAILVEMGRLGPDVLAEAMRQQMGAVLLELARWPSGFFAFEAMAIRDPGDVEVDARDLLVAEGVSADRVLIELVTALDEGGAEPPVSVGEIALELRAPTLRGETTLKLMRHAARLVKRGVLFAVRGDALDGIAHFGLEDPEAEDRVRRLSLPLDEPGTLAETVQKKQTYRGPLTPRPGDGRLQIGVGGPRPPEAVVIPVVLAGSVALVFYGDNAPSGDPVASTASLEELFEEAALGMEREALEERARDFERRRTSRSRLGG